MDSQEVDSFSESQSLERILQSEDLQEIVASALPHPHTPVKPALKYRVENNNPVVTADLTPRKKRRSKTLTQTRDRSSSPIGTTTCAGTGKRKALFEVAITLTAEKEIFVQAHLGDSSIDVANRVLPDGARTAVKKFAEEIEKEINAYMIGITKELASFQRLNKETLETRSKSALDRIKPPDLQIAKRARLKEKQVLGAVSVDPGNGTHWNITVREGDRAVDLAMESCTKHGLSHAQIEDIPAPILNSSDSRNHCSR